LFFFWNFDARAAAIFAPCLFPSLTNYAHLLLLLVAAGGTQWDENNYSCAYDALFTILFNIWVTEPRKWMKIF
jgi:hypothetical protein